MHTMHRVWFWLVLLVNFLADGFLFRSINVATSFRQVMQFAKASKKKKGSKGTPSGVKGFGSLVETKNIHVNVDRSQEARDFYTFLENVGAGENLKRTTLGYFPILPGDTSLMLRGVVALKDMKTKDVIINIPYEAAIDLGADGEDPTVPAVSFLRMYCEAMKDEVVSKHKSYFKMLPRYLGDDCLGSTDFFSDEALDALQSPLIVEETLKRRDRTLRRFEASICSDDSFPKWIDGTPVTVDHLQWAVWLITSRVLTVQRVEGERSRKLLIPYLDMCNHDRSSTHVLTGRAVNGGELKVVAGSNVKAGDQISICYGGGVAGNDRFIQDYGFFDTASEGFLIVAQQLLGKSRIQEGANIGKSVPIADRERTLDALRRTKIADDELALHNESDPSIRAAIQYRLALKRALSRFVLIA